MREEGKYPGLNLNQKRRKCTPKEAEQLLLEGVRGYAHEFVRHAFQLSNAALSDEPEELPTQIVARLQSVKSAAVQKVLKSVRKSVSSEWLNPIRAPLIPAGGPIEKILKVDFPFDQSKALIWSRDGKSITWFYRASFRTLDLDSGEMVSSFDLPLEGHMVGISNPPSRAVVVAAQRHLLFVDLKTASSQMLDSQSIIENVAIAANGAWAVTTSVPSDWDYLEMDWNGPRIFCLLDMERCVCVRTWQAHRAVVQDLALSADGRFLLTGSRDKTVQLLDLQRNAMVGSWRCGREVQAVALTPSGHRLAYVSRGGKLTIRNRNGNVLGQFTNCGAEVGCLALNPQGSKVVFAMDGDVSVVDVRKSTRSGPFGGTQPYQSSLVIQSQAQRAITGEAGNQVVVWDLTRLEKTESTGGWIKGIWAKDEESMIHVDHLFLWSHLSGECSKLRSARRCEIAAAASAGLWAIAEWGANGDGQVRVGQWGRPATKQLFASQELSLSLSQSIQFSRNGTRLAAHILQDGCCVVDVHNGRTVWEKKSLGRGVNPYLSPSGAYLVCSSITGFVEVLDLDAKVLLQALQLEPIITRVLFVDDELLAIPQGDKTLLWAWRSNVSSVLCEGAPSSISDDGQWLVTQSKSRKLSLWNLVKRRRAATYTLDVPVQETALSPDGGFLVVGDQSGGIHILRREEPDSKSN